MVLKAVGLNESTDVQKRDKNKGLGQSITQGQPRRQSRRGREVGGKLANCDVSKAKRKKCFTIGREISHAHHC